MRLCSLLSWDCAAAAAGVFACGVCLGVLVYLCSGTGVCLLACCLCWWAVCFGVIGFGCCVEFASLQVLVLLGGFLAGLASVLSA